MELNYLFSCREPMTGLRSSAWELCHGKVLQNLVKVRVNTEKAFSLVVG